MDDRRFPFDSGFDDGVYGTGCTEPPKSHRAVIALLLVAVIFDVVSNHKTGKA